MHDTIDHARRIASFASSRASSKDSAVGFSVQIALPAAMAFLRFATRRFVTSASK